MIPGKGSKRGGALVFICLILSSLIFAIGVLGELASGMAARPYANAIFDLAGRSVISEYDRTLKDRYGLFGFLMDDEEIEEKLRYYSGESFTKPRGYTSLLPLEIGEIKIDTSEHVMLNLDLVENQILDLMKYQVVLESERILDILDLQEIKEKSNDEGAGQNGKAKKRKLMSNKVIEQLPSRSLEMDTGGFKNILNIPGPESLGTLAYNELCLNLYILRYFRHELDSAQWDNSFFSNEIEYILCGNLKDETNKEIIYLSLLAFRTSINATHIYSDTAKWAAVTAAALAGGGVGTIPAQVAITAAWAGAEAVSDMNRLMGGGRVPLIKTAGDWVLSIDAALEGIVNEVVTGSENEKGLNYEDYLFLLLCLKDRDSKLIRMMDLMQINIIGIDNQSFAFSRCLGGFSFEGTLYKPARFPGFMALRKGEISGTHVY